MTPVITDDIIRDVAQTLGMLRSGLAYFQQGRVSDLAFDKDLNMVSAIVRGSGSNRYWTSVIFPEVEGDLIDSECSCPVGFGCKHAVALLYALQEAMPSKPRLRITAAAREMPNLSGGVGTWLDQIALDGLAAGLVSEAVCFVIEPKRAFKQAAAKGRKTREASTIGPQDRYLLQIRAWRKSRHAEQWRPFHAYEIQYGGLTCDPLALRLLARMSPVSAGGDFTADKVPMGRHGWQWLCEAVAAGLLRWKKPDGLAISLANDTTKANFDWQVLGDGRRCLNLTGLPEGLTVFAGDPPVVVDENQGMLSLLDTGIALPMAGRLLAMPPVAEIDIPLLASRWADIVGDAVPPPAAADLEEISQTPPRPVLRFMMDKIESRVSDKSWYRERYQQMQIKTVRLTFDYKGHRVAAPAPSAEVIARTGTATARIMRDLAAEQAAVDRLAALPLLPLALAEGIKVKPHQTWDHALEEGGGDYPTLLIHEIAALEREGWLIEQAPDWPDVYRPLDTAPLGLALASEQQGQDGNDWFDMELPAWVDGARIDILPALRQLLAAQGEALLEEGDEHQLVLKLADGGFTAVPLGALRPLLAALLRLALMDRAASTLRVNRYDLGMIQDLSAEGVTWTSQDALRHLARALHDPEQAHYAPPVGLKADLRPYQRSGVVWLAALHGAGLGGILADDMGLGKTLQAIAHILHVRQAEAAAPKPVLIVAPTSVLPNWQAELARFAPDLDCLLWHGIDRRKLEDDLASSAIVLTSYPLLSRDKDILTGQDYALVVLDEAHVLKNPATAGFKAAVALKASQTIALSGTPIENRLNDIWALASLTNRGLLGGFEAFRKTYRTPIEKQGDAQAKAALARRLRPFMLRRTKDEVAADLPPKTLIPERIELNEAQIRLYESQRLLMHQRVREEIDRVGLMRSQIIVLDAMLKLRQICCDPSLLPGGLGEGVASAKRARLLEMLPELIEEGRRVIVFSQFTSMMDRISMDLVQVGIEHEQLRGTTRDRSRPVRRFQNGEVPVILVSLKAGGAGVNLTAADTVILYDPWWNPAVEAQAIDRAHRIGQKKPVFVHRMIATGTIEEKILALQERKQGLADVLWIEAAGSGTALDDADIAFLLG